MGNAAPPACTCVCGGDGTKGEDLLIPSPAFSEEEKKERPDEETSLTLPIRRKHGSRRVTENPKKLLKRLKTIDWVPEDDVHVEQDFENADFDEETVPFVD